MERSSGTDERGTGLKRRRGARWTPEEEAEINDYITKPENRHIPISQLARELSVKLERSAEGVANHIYIMRKEARDRERETGR